MRQRRGHLTHRGDPPRVSQLVPGLSRFLLGMLAGRDVDHQGEVPSDNAPVVPIRNVKSFERTALPTGQSHLGHEGDLLAGENARDIRKRQLIQLVSEYLANRMARSALRIDAEPRLVCAVHEDITLIAVDVGDQGRQRIGNQVHSPLALRELTLGTVASSPLEEQPGDQQRLQRNQRHDAEDVPPVDLPERRRTKQDRAARRQTIQGNVPALQLPVVEGRRSGLDRRRVDARRVLTSKDTDRDTGGLDAE